MQLDNPNVKGAVAELKIATAATALGVPVLRPMTERGRYDLAFDLGGRILRVQCKWASAQGDVAVVRLQSSYLTGRREVKAVYDDNEIDAVGVYCSPIDRATCFPSS